MRAAVMNHKRKGVNRIAHEKNDHLLDLSLAESTRIIVQTRVALRHRLQLVEEVCDDLTQREGVLQLIPLLIDDVYFFLLASTLVTLVHHRRYVLHRT